MRLKVVQEARVESVLISYMLHLSIVYSESSCTTVSRQIYETRLYASKETAIGRLVVLRKHLPPQRLNIALETGCTWRWDRLTLGLPVSRAELCPAKLSCLRLRCAEPFTCTFEARKPCGFVLKSAANCITAGREQKVCAAMRASLAIARKEGIFLARFQKVCAMRWWVHLPSCCQHVQNQISTLPSMGL